MLVVTEADAAAIRTAFHEKGELSAIIELRQRFPGITDHAKAGPAPGPSPAGSRRPRRRARWSRCVPARAGSGRSLTFGIRTAP
jgi:hypothetical protein